MNKVSQAFQALRLEPTLRYAPRIPIDRLCTIEENCQPYDEITFEYQYDVKIVLGASIRCQESDLGVVKSHICADVNHYIYGEIYGKTLELRTALWEDNMDRVREIVEEILKYTGRTYE